MNKVMLVAIKEIKSFLQDRADLAYSLLLPVTIFALIYGAFGGQSSFSGTAFVVNEDLTGEYSKILLEKLEEYKNLEVKLLAANDAERKLDRSDITMLLIIPADFSANLASNKETSLIFKQRGNGGFEEQVVANMIRGAAEEVAQEIRVIKKVTEAVAGKNVTLTSERIKMVVEKFSDREKNHPVVNINVEDVGGSPDPVATFLPGILTMFVLFSLSINSRVLIEEKKKGTLERLMSTQLTVAELFIGKFLANTGRAFIQLLILLVLAYVAFQIFTPPTFLIILLVSLFFSLAAGAIGLLISTISRTEDQAIWFGVVFTIVMVMLGGTFFTAPKGSLLYTLGQFSINTHVNAAYKSIISNQIAFSLLSQKLFILVCVTIFTLGLSRLFFRVLPEGR